MQAEILKINSDNPEVSLIRYAADQIRAGEVLGMPTDTFYGLAADPFNLRAVDRVYDIKSRSRHKPLSLLIADVDQAEELAQPLPEEFHALARRFWPGPLTLILPAPRRGNCPSRPAGWSGTCRHWPSRRIPRRAQPWPSQRDPQAGLDEKLSCAEIAAAAVVILVAAVIGNAGTAGEQYHHDQHDNSRQRLEKNRLHAIDMAPAHSGFNRPDFTSSLTPAS